MGSEAVSGIVRGEQHARAVRAALESAGVRVSDISVLFATREAAGADLGAKDVRPVDIRGLDGRSGATVGAVLGLVAGGFGIAISGLGPLVAGPLIATVGSAVIGAAAGALVGMRLPDARDLVLSVYTESPSQVRAVKQILEAHAAAGVSARATNIE